MSDTAKRPYAHMLPRAQAIVASLQPYVERIEIAGSLRRGEPLIGDIEIVAIPRFYIDLFGQPSADSAVDTWIGYLRTHNPSFVLDKNGNKMKSFRLEQVEPDTSLARLPEVKVDLFLQPNPATWGVNLLIRTGPWHFSRWMVSKQSVGGACPDNLTVNDARIWRQGKALPTPEEADVFALFGMDYIEPAHRAAATPEGYRQ